MLCPNCKKEVTTRFCPDCGLEINPAKNMHQTDSNQDCCPEQRKTGWGKRQNKPRRRIDQSLIWIAAIVIGIIVLSVLALRGARVLFDQYMNGLEWLFYN